jgi:hypothetical protein
MKQFETGMTYAATMDGETRDFEDTIRVVKRTAKTITYIETAWTGAESEAKKARIKADENGEYIKPGGNYTGARIIRAA